MTITALPEWPVAGDAAFAAKMDAVGVALPTTITEMNAQAVSIDAAATAAATSETNAAASAAAALVSENSAAATANVTLWVSGINGSVGENKYSPINFLPYKRKNTGAFTTDPSLDATNWVLQVYNIADDLSQIHAITYGD